MKTCPAYRARLEELPETLGLGEEVGPDEYPAGGPERGDAGCCRPAPANEEEAQPVLRWKIRGNPDNQLQRELWPFCNRRRKGSTGLLLLLLSLLCKDQEGRLRAKRDRESCSLFTRHCFLATPTSVLTTPVNCWWVGVVYTNLKQNGVCLKPTFLQILESWTRSSRTGLKQRL